MPPRANLNVTLPVIPLIISALFHFTLSSLALLYGGVPAGYFFVHLALLMIGVWSSHDKLSLTPVFAYIYVLLFSGLVDIIFLGVYWSGLANEQPQPLYSLGRFCAAMAIINLIFKPGSLLFSVFVIYQRSNGFKFSDYFQKLFSMEFQPDISLSIWHC
jgi:hypothetical protein